MRFPRLPPHAKIMEAVHLTRDTQIGKSKFLTDEFNAEKIVSFANLSKEDNVCELGAGFGILSKQILKQNVKSLFSVEWNRLCLSHLSKFPKYHSNHLVKHGDPYFMDFIQEFDHLKDEPNPNMSLFICSALKARNISFIEQYLEDLVHQRQLFYNGNMKVKIITLIDANRAKRICGDDVQSGVVHDLLYQNYFQIQLGPFLKPTSFTNIEDSPCFAVKLTPLPQPRIDIPFSQLKQLVRYLSGPNPYSRNSSRTIEENLTYSGVLNSENSDMLCSYLNDLNIDPCMEQKDLNFIDLVKLTNVMHILHKPDS